MPLKPLDVAKTGMPTMPDNFLPTFARQDLIEKSLRCGHATGCGLGLAGLALNFLAARRAGLCDAPLLRA
jgi:hypothetical protein